MITQQNKKILSIIILSLILIIAALGAYFLKKYHPKNGANSDFPGKSTLNITCNFASEKEIMLTAQKNNQPELCVCIKNQKKREACIKSVVNINLYNQAIKSLNLSLCNEISSSSIKNACQSIVASGLEQTNEK